MRIDLALNILAKRYTFLRKRIDANRGKIDCKHDKSEATAIRKVAAVILALDDVFPGRMPWVADGWQHLGGTRTHETEARLKARLHSDAVV